MISFVTGKPGGGKGLVAMREVIAELVHGERPIITNLAIRIEPWVRIGKVRGKRTVKSEMGLQAYLMREYGQDFNVRRRVHILPDDQVGEFYLYRVDTESWKLVKSDAKRDAAGRVVEYSTENALRWGGVLYVVDEAWKFYGARSWQDTGKGVLFYGAQHRKLADRWLIVCQNTKQVDTALRQVAEDFWVSVNHAKKKLGVWRQPEVFQLLIYGEVPTGAGEPMSRQVFRLDKIGLGGTYDTSGGVGVVGGGTADIGERAKGMPIWSIAAGLLLLGALCYGGAKSLGWGTKKMLMGNKHPEAEAGSASVVKSSGVGGPKAIPHVVASPAGAQIPPMPEKIVYVTGWSRISDAVALVSLSDGRTVGPSEGLTEIADHYATIRGKRYALANSH